MVTRTTEYNYTDNTENAAFLQIFLTATHLAIVMEYAAGGNLHSYIVARSKEKGGQGLGEKEAKWFFQQVCPS